MCLLRLWTVIKGFISVIYIKYSINSSISKVGGNFYGVSFSFEIARVGRLTCCGGESAFSKDIFFSTLTFFFDEFAKV